VPDVAVEVGPGEDNDQRRLRVKLVKAADRTRAAPGVKRDQGVTRPLVIVLAYAHAVAELFQERGPAQSSNAVAVIDAQRRGCDELDVHGVG